MTGESATEIYVMACVVGFVVGVLMATRKHDSEATCKGVTLRLPVPDHVPEPPDRPFVMPPQVVVMSADSGILDRTVTTERAALTVTADRELVTTQADWHEILKDAAELVSTQHTESASEPGFIHSPVTDMSRAHDAPHPND